MSSITSSPKLSGALASPSPTILPTDIPRRPSPWHDIAHSLSTTPLPPSSRRDSMYSSQLPTPPSSDSDTPPAIPLALSYSQALRDWEERLYNPSSDAMRHQLVHPNNRSRTPKLVAERDKVGFIEYKLKLIEPTPVRFERLVTQMMWRLKQGKNEAIYELGLADDGTVVGLTRVEMDASLRTLELMASEVGATVIVLKEIVLGAPSSASVWPQASIESSNGVSSNTHSQNQILIQDWPVEVPDLGDVDPLQKGSKPVGKRGAQRDRRDRKKEKNRRLMKKLEARGERWSGSDQDPESPRHRLNSTSSVVSLSTGSDSSFAFDMDEIASPLNKLPSRNEPSAALSKHSAKPGRPGPLPKSDKKRRQSAAKQEKRRLDLLRGDGTNPIWAEMTRQAPDLLEESDVSTKVAVPYQPARPSSLRLTTPAQLVESESFDDDLLHIPLDSLSLSFADVRTVDTPQQSEPYNPSSSSPDHSASESEAETETVLPQDGAALASSAILAPPAGEDFICVEALVVRKVQHNHRGDEEGVEEEEWIYGGEEDVWGFGAEGD